MTTFSEQTVPQRRRAIAGWASDARAMRCTLRNGDTHDLVFLGIAQEARPGYPAPDQWSNKGTAAVARFYSSSNLVVLPLLDIHELEPMAYSVTDPNHPDYQPEERVVRPIPKEAMLGRKGYREPRPMPH